MIEGVIAQVTLTDNMSLGLAYAAKTTLHVGGAGLTGDLGVNADTLAQFNGSTTTSQSGGTAALPSSTGFSYIAKDDSGLFRVYINALANNSEGQAARGAAHPCLRQPGSAHPGRTAGAHRDVVDHPPRGNVERDHSHPDDTVQGHRHHPQDQAAGERQRPRGTRSDAGGLYLRYDPARTESNDHHPQQDGGIDAISWSRTATPSPSADSSGRTLRTPR